ncbi:AtpZ/AtpI family protein [Candidatus Poribacteria bacterium]|jgi:hypothetical protein|nr:AtpZ/AtpI family protein [Candidatus Poribacteria bacterium]MBT5536047.1 AtpZ/AtpI family protein [Candidatus Poribacteria bacterium]MBT5713482.1 AtpZ/AtpI family protein [Candidatus Poribacteria bacterium]MBT7098954.1 AtpZ/AtpI family protein [Candidatus Poribacteria bacterium]MBT7808677.1 AtpZ/AtpI family protein [Candidatus Poribacteria bacterium]
MDPDVPPGAPRGGWAAVGELTSLAMTLAICVLIGLLGGRWIGRKLGAEDAGTLGGVAFGVVAAGYELRRVALRLERKTRDETRRRERDGADGHDS